MNYGFADAAGAEAQAMLLLHPEPDIDGGSGFDGGNGDAGGGMEMVVGPEGPNETARTWLRAVLSGDEALFAHGERLCTTSVDYLHCQAPGAVLSGNSRRCPPTVSVFVPQVWITCTVKHQALCSQATRRCPLTVSVFVPRVWITCTASTYTRSSMY